jgi:hypothetical protein
VPRKYRVSWTALEALPDVTGALTIPQAGYGENQQIEAASADEAIAERTRLPSE